MKNCNPIEEWSVKVPMVKKLWLVMDQSSARVYLNRDQARGEKDAESILLPVALTVGQQKVVNQWLNTDSR